MSKEKLKVLLILAVLLMSVVIGSSGGFDW